jgi:cytidyltransferase-like protein
MNMKIVATSGYYDYVHCGHLESFNLAKQLGDYLVVFVDSDNKAIKKKGFVIMPENERAEIIRNIKCVDEVIVIDSPISEALEKYKPNIFAKGGDRTIDNLPQDELDVCKKNNIEIVCGLGNKIQASSKLIDKTSVTKPWGKYNVITQGLGYLIKKITINPHSKISLQYHNNRSEYWTVQSGEITALLDYEPVVLIKSQSIFIPIQSVHRMVNDSDDVAEIIEVQIGITDELDIVRIEDDYNRA